MDYSKKRVLILGGGASGLSVFNILQSWGCDAHLINDTRKSSLTNDFIKSFDECVISPGISIYDPNILMCFQNNVPVISELEFGFRLNKSRLIAITGTNGKTTTVSLISHILSQGGIKNEPLGNIGTPFSSKALAYGKDDILPLEVSSFQLEAIQNFRPFIAGILNITPDHLDRHLTMQNYIQCKTRIFKNQTNQDYLIANRDQYEILPYLKSLSKKLYISQKQKVNGAWCLNGKIFIDGKYLIDRKDLKLIGDHNVYNALMAALCAYLVDIDFEIIGRVLNQFNGVKHRLQYAGNLDGITFINDSKATNADSSLVAIKSMTAPTVLILGGSDKGISLLDYFKKIKNSFNHIIKYIVIYGAAKHKMLSDIKSVGLLKKTILANDFSDAFFKSAQAAEGVKPCNVLLSPACASFDEFVNFEARGQKFIELVKSLGASQ
ncbi:MAG: UDP-N-acetylmuramoyl-L-alanine--D-glutamate ligase [Clostridiales bacterium]|nr:UDP-N-acetylmuramoyl-L-alanine--D-glutamate ligase [Clostridiales bacterium]